MTYTAPPPNFLKNRTGTDSSILSEELVKIDAAIDTAKTNYIDLTAGKGTDTTLATAGIDLASGSNATYYAVFCAPVDIHVTAMYDFLTEAYKKDTTDAKIEIVTEATTPVTIATRTLADGETAKSQHTTTPAVTAVAAGTILNLKITATGASTGTGYARVIMAYTVD